MNSSPENSAQALMTLDGISQSYRIGDRVIPVLRIRHFANGGPQPAYPAGQDTVTFRYSY
jgi:hypothetical protein